MSAEINVGLVGYGLGGRVFHAPLIQEAQGPHLYGVRYLIEVGSISRIPRPRFQARGSLGSLTKTGLDPQESALKEGRVRGAVDPPEHYAHLVTEIHGLVFEGRIPTLPGNYPAYYQNIADVLWHGADLLVKPEDVREAVRVIEGALESARQGQVLPFSRG